MFSRAARAVRPIARSAFRPVKPETRLFSVTAKSLSDHAAQPQIFGPGAKPGEVPTLFDQATGVERLQLLADIEGVDAFDLAPLDASRVGTLKDPIIVPSLDPERLVGCTGCPADSHDTIWFPVSKDRVTRCVECGSVYALDYQGLEHDDHGHGHH
ncbi:COX5B-domain-containing protein [Mycena floridula]|nr:COX5B-domain-containing protein [Mycena floridula]